jgi:hypothetical protein
MIIYIAPQDKEMRKKTLEFAKTNEVRMIEVDDTLVIEEVNKGKNLRYLNESYMFTDAETIWIVGHGNAVEIGDKSKGVTMKADDLVSLLLSTVIADGKKYHGSIVIDTCKSGVNDGGGKTFADRVYEKLKDLPKATVGGWVGSVSGPISGGVVKLDGMAFRGEAGFAWAGGKQPDNIDHQVLGKLAG